MGPMPWRSTRAATFLSSRCGSSAGGSGAGGSVNALPSQVPFLVNETVPASTHNSHQFSILDGNDFGQIMSIVCGSSTSGSGSASGSVTSLRSHVPFFSREFVPARHANPSLSASKHARCGQTMVKGIWQRRRRQPSESPAQRCPHLMAVIVPAWGATPESHSACIQVP